MREDPEGPIDPARHLRMMPVLAVADRELVEAVRAGALRAGRDPVLLVVLEADEPTLIAVREAGAEVVVCVCAGPTAVRSLNLAGRLGARAVPVLALAGGGGAPRLLAPSLALLGDEELLNTNVPVPAVADDAHRTALWDQLRGAHIEERHHLVEVDGTAALDELASRGLDVPHDRWAALAAGAAGVLAGRMAAGNRRWRRQLEA